jgi:SOS response regulatory protein OraA/RecX
VAPRVTALVAEPRGRVRVELDGAPWRVLPAGAVAGARLTVGVELDRPRARTLGRELRRVDALAAATAALSRRDRSGRALGDELARRGIAPRERSRAVEVLERAGYVDDLRFAETRAASLAGRGYGDEAIRFDLERNGVTEPVLSAALAPLLPEEARARMLVAGLGASARTARRLASRGFAAESIEAAVGVEDPER